MYLLVGDEEGGVSCHGGATASLDRTGMEKSAWELSPQALSRMGAETYSSDNSDNVGAMRCMVLKLTTCFSPPTTTRATTTSKSRPGCAP